MSTLHSYVWLARIRVRTNRVSPISFRRERLIGSLIFCSTAPSARIEEAALVRLPGRPVDSPNHRTAI